MNRILGFIIILLLIELDISAQSITQSLQEKATLFTPYTGCAFTIDVVKDRNCGKAFGLKVKNLCDYTIDVQIAFRMEDGSQESLTLVNIHRGWTLEAEPKCGRTGQYKYVVKPSAMQHGLLTKQEWMLANTMDRSEGGYILLPKLKINTGANVATPPKKYVDGVLTNTITQGADLAPMRRRPGDEIPIPFTDEELARFRKDTLNEDLPYSQQDIFIASDNAPSGGLKPDPSRFADELEGVNFQVLRAYRNCIREEIQYTEAYGKECFEIRFRNICNEDLSISYAIEQVGNGAPRLRRAIISAGDIGSASSMAGQWDRVCEATGRYIILGKPNRLRKVQFPSQEGYNWYWQMFDRYP